MEDGQTYEAVVVSIDHENEMCRVRYLGYGNEEDQSITDLLPSREYDDIRMSEVLSEVGVTFHYLFGIIV